MSLFRGENVYPTYAQFTPVASQPVNAGEGSLWLDFATRLFKGVANGSIFNLSGVVAKADTLAQSANIAATTLYTVPAGAGGTYRLSGYVVLTQAATTSSTAPSIIAFWTDIDTNIFQGGVGFTQTFTNNLVGVNSATNSINAGIITFQAKAGTVIQWGTSSYASSGATPMQYGVHVKLEYLGT